MVLGSSKSKESRKNWVPGRRKKAMGVAFRLTLLYLELGTAHSWCLINVSIVACHF